MDKYRLQRSDPAIRTPKTTRYNRRRRRQDIRDDSSDSSIENERWRNNYAAVKNLLYDADDASGNEESSERNQSLSTDSSQPASEPGSFENENGSNISHDNAIPLIDNGMLNDGSPSYESEDELEVIIL
ncbi:hypothetical protein TSAR_016198 [Trichomalopsis sarcophagae]|uniref:Uncharacterized protein n=1 Tax=Trichomalopsis sarcophagae TaxID=543379 RepID=A0A232EMY3_9HYME|nr:hypothetical protein TSAR_016198 [Trichomalopsis sarcophagae]